MSTGHYEAATRADQDEFGQVCPRRLSAREVLDMHADLQRMLAQPEPWFHEGMLDYAVRDVGDKPQWMASHLHPSTSMSNLDPWFRSLGGDLFGATTYQVTAEMIDLAEALVTVQPGHRQDPGRGPAIGSGLHVVRPARAPAIGRGR